MPIYQLNTPQVVQETIEGEVVIVNMNNGAYYSTQNLGTVIWQRVLDGHSTAEIIAEIASHYPAEALETITRDVAYTIDSFEKEGLILPDDTSTASQGEASSAPVWPEAYQMPEITKYVDMQNILLLDPIHEIDTQSGWPHQEPDS